MANKDSSKPKKRMSKKASLGLEGSRSKPQKENMPIEAATVKIQSPKQEQIRSAPLTGKKAISKAQNQTGDLGVPQGVKRKGSPLSAAVGPDTCLKRQKSPGVRIIGGRVYDSENGQTCHQCRQKTIEFMAPCKNTSGDKVCTQKFCPKCLLNRYGENVEEAFELVDWFCPRCRGICNCSICMKKKGCTPTGILTHTAKATGFGSVADFLKQASQKSMVF
ncbi:hypothetical protein O6H91_18G071400 [Diphasiastrum complanatum]|uniref:Uncharacterized protein n=3 Tax=Diphasiastrum complanatum TaxID=34168 RepID=A0ACC2B3I3_DIPCM|nr:hypothetical protein O6H91_18G071400 [Diphasiastrum complanatum]KAJ7523982.1 hypothetical protein O6H91_18G071400 [Diphasiastrum complanatum]KAJ7523983.1 hypothetical protein O6H91_18G071400 [Diphasiastrum complanatum]